MALPAAIVEPIAELVAHPLEDCRCCRLGPFPEIDDDVEIRRRVDTVAEIESPED